MKVIEILKDFFEDQFDPVIFIIIVPYLICIIVGLIIYYS